MTINDYILNHTEEEDQTLTELSRETYMKVLRPRMLTGHYQGKFIQMLSKMICPENILEIGTYTGYSAICWAKGLSSNGIIDTIEINDELEPIIKKHFKKAKIEEKVKLHIGDALKIIPGIDKKFDIVFIDADKPNYLNYYKSVFNKVKTGGYIIADNVLWNNKVIKQDFFKDESTNGIIEFNKYVHHDSRVENFLLNIRDGLMVLRKK
ncbi:MAG: class I SAM-dependent methyltransferase [Bacteroidales bacterium]|nr:class I SAM-dependent methyltransferase [Bacteroidales bacterium]